jgi:hypothetical protein
MLYYVILKATLFVLGLWWCKEIVERFPNDIAELKRPNELVHKIVIGFFWLLTIGIVFLLVRFILRLIDTVVQTLG